MAIDGIYTVENADRRSIGEAGLRHLTNGIGDMRFHSVETARQFAFALLDRHTEDTPLVACLRPVIRINPRLGRRTMGRYYRKHHLGPLVEMCDRLELATLVHELAHCVNHLVHDSRGHNAQFKAVFVELLEHTYRMLDRPVPELTCRVEKRDESGLLLTVQCGVEVMVDDGRGKLFMGVITKRNPKTCKVQDEDGKIWVVPHHMIEV